VARAPFQVLVFPFMIVDDRDVIYAVFKRSDNGIWQAVAGGGEDDETPLEAAHREAAEEGGIHSGRIIELDSRFTVPAVEVSGMLWGAKVLVLPEYCFGIEVDNKDLILSDEHDAFRWLNYDDARAILHWDSNKNALWELNYRLRHFLERSSENV